MKVNVDKVLERDAKLSELDSRAGNSVLTGKFKFSPCRDKTGMCSCMLLSVISFSFVQFY